MPCRKYGDTDLFDSNFTKLCVNFGMTSNIYDIATIHPSDCLPVILDGKVIGFIEE